jgi:hypothetical protein
VSSLLTLIILLLTTSAFNAQRPPQSCQQTTGTHFPSTGLTVPVNPREFLPGKNIPFILYEGKIVIPAERTPAVLKKRRREGAAFFIIAVYFSFDIL